MYSISWWWARARAAARWRDGCRRIRDLGGAARCRRQQRQLGGDDAVRADPDGRGQGQQLGVRHRAAEGPERPHRLSAARQGARRLFGDQRHGLYPRPPLRTTTTGPRSATPAGAMPTCCPTSSARRTMPISTASITARAGPLHVNRLRTGQSGAADLPAGAREKRNSASARISTPRTMKGSASTR